MNLNNQIIECQPKKLSWEDQHEDFHLSFNQQNEKTKELQYCQKQQQVLQNQQKNLNYCELFYKQKQKNFFLQKKVKELQEKLQKYQKIFSESIISPNLSLENNQIINLSQKNQRNKSFLTKSKLTLLDDIQSFKSFLPNSIKFIDFRSEKNSDPQIEQFKSVSYNSKFDELKKNGKITELIQCFAIFQLKQINEQQFESNKENSQRNCQQTQRGQLVYCSKKNPDKLIEHSSKLVFPESYSPKEVNSQKAIEKAEQILKLNEQELKSFLLIFEPQNCIFDKKQNNERKSQCSLESQQQPQSLLKLMNQQQRYYAICISLQDFQYIRFHSQLIHKIMNPDFDNSLDQDLFDRHMKTQQNQNQLNKFEKQLIHIKTTSIKTTQTVFAIFSKYPFFKQFQDTLKSVLKVIKYNRQTIFAQNKNNLADYDCRLTFQLFQKQISKILIEYNQKQPTLNQSLQLKITKDSKILFSFKKLECQNLFVELWAYPLLSLFTLDTFMDVLTLIMLQQKVIFVCQNQHILTYAIFLFVKILCRPFKYPYPVVSIIPNQFQYFNAPFPIVYGCVKQKKVIQKQKIMSKYKNAYVFLNPEGVQISSQLKLSNILMKKSLKLRDKLMPQFISMKKNYPKLRTSFSLSSFFGFKSVQINQNKKKYDFDTNNKDISMSIIKCVQEYFSNIKNLFPNKNQLQSIKNNLTIQKIKLAQTQKYVKKEDAINDSINDFNRILYQKAKNIAKKRTKDLFALNFLETQIMGVNLTL